MGKRFTRKFKQQKPLRKRSNHPLSLIQRKIWEHCKRLTRGKYGNVCYTCGKTDLKGVQWHTGHLWPKASLGAYMKYDLRILRPQCFHCNIELGGNGARFYARMLEENGAEYMSQLEMSKQIMVKAMDHYLKLLEEYESLI